MSADGTAYQRAAERLCQARRVVAFTGAGISAESGIPTFRDPGGLWEQFRPEELATPEAFERNPDRVWAWYQHRRRVIAAAEPNPGHYALAAMEPHFEEFTVVTQNIDQLHQRAGSRRVLELHGSILRNHCHRCGRPYEAPNLPEERAPTCPHCGGRIRPSVVWFGELLPEDVFAEAEQAVARCDVLLSIGTSGEVYPAAGLVWQAKLAGATVIEVNPNPTELTPAADIALRGSAATVLPELLRRLCECRQKLSKAG
ncbi:MAG: NAD-dependent deacylase [Candidatus Kapabacteria bacterium]|nr:NAD-dependent deacylase [Candidatus Kapabacteria bacterium]MDW8011811.1 NAD-dependent deacylase [Bacteroidota bacterium]